jgi:hypothetical protein
MDWRQLETQVAPKRPFWHTIGKHPCCITSIFLGNVLIWYSENATDVLASRYSLVMYSNGLSNGYYTRMLDFSLVHTWDELAALSVTAVLMMFVQILFGWIVVRLTQPRIRFRLDAFMKIWAFAAIFSGPLIFATNVPMRLVLMRSRNWGFHGYPQSWWSYDCLAVLAPGLLSAIRVVPAVLTSMQTMWVCRSYIKVLP